MKLTKINKKTVTALPPPEAVPPPSPPQHLSATNTTSEGWWLFTCWRRKRKDQELPTHSPPPTGSPPPPTAALVVDPPAPRAKGWGWLVLVGTWGLVTMLAPMVLSSRLRSWLDQNPMSEAIEVFHASLHALLLLLIFAIIIDERVSYGITDEKPGRWSFSHVVAVETGDHGRTIGVIHPRKLVPRHDYTLLRRFSP
ncbi:hypothetical protein T439DRAFT_383626 [Meredithblackwellia eburnea MCA 4105]